MFCEKCGTKLEAGSLFCENCGAKIVNMSPESGTKQKSSPPSPSDDPSMHEAFEQVQQSVQQQITTLRRPRTPKSSKVFLFELMILTLLIVLFFVVGNLKFSPKTIAKTYAKAMAAGDWETLHSLLDLSSSELLSEDFFVAAQLSLEQDEIDDFSVEEVDIYSDGERYRFECQFETKYDDFYRTIHVIKQNDKNWLFFDDWKIEADWWIAEDVQIGIPADATLSINGVDVSTIKNIKTENRETTCIYILPDMFYGTYLFEVSAPGRETRREEVDVSSYAYYNFTDLIPASDAIDSIAKQSRDNIELIFTGLMTKTAYADFIVANKPVFDLTNNFSYGYESWLKNFTGEGYYLYNSIEIDDIRCTLSNYGYNYDTKRPFMRMNLESSIAITGYEINYDWWHNTTSYDPYSTTNRFNSSFMYELDGDKWVLTEINLYN